MAEDREWEETETHTGKRMSMWQVSCVGLGNESCLPAECDLYSRSKTSICCLEQLHINN